MGVGTIQGTAFSSNIYCRATFLHGFCRITINMVHAHFSIPLVYPQSTVAVFLFFNVAYTETCHVTGYLILSVVIDSVYCRISLIVTRGANAYIVGNFQVAANSNPRASIPHKI